MSNDTMRETVRRARELLAFVSPEPDNWDEHNALIAAGLCNDELPALCDEIERLRAEVARARAAGLREALAIAREVESEHSDLLLCSDLTYGKACGAGIVAGCIEELIAKGGGA